MFIHFNGYGFVAFLLAVPPLLSAAFLVPHHEQLGTLIIGATLIAAGIACVRLGRRWNEGLRFFERHSLYWIPMEIWGWTYLAVGTVVFAPLAWKVVLEAVSAII